MFLCQWLLDDGIVGFVPFDLLLCLCWWMVVVMVNELALFYFHLFQFNLYSSYTLNVSFQFTYCVSAKCKHSNKPPFFHQTNLKLIVEYLFDFYHLFSFISKSKSKEYHSTNLYLL